MAFKAVDEDESNSLEHTELARTIRDAVNYNGVRQPTEADIEMIVRDIDKENHGSIDSSEFALMIMNVFDKMMDNEDELVKKVGDEDVQ